MNRYWFRRSTGAFATGFGAALFLLATFVGLFVGDRYWLGSLGAVFGIALGTLCLQRGVAEVGRPSFIAAALRSPEAVGVDHVDRLRSRLVVAAVVVLCGIAVAAAAFEANEVLHWTAQCWLAILLGDDAP